MILDPEVVLGQYLNPMTYEVEAEREYYMSTIYRLTLQLTNICVIQHMFRQLVIVAHLHT